jgi:hypothetical protein
MILLDKHSILKSLPKTISFEQYIILDAIRFTIEIIQISYDELLKELEAISTKKDKNIPKAFNSAWNIIDNIQRLNEIYKKFPQQTELTLFKDIAEIKFFRNSYQHLEDRIKEIIIDKRLPVFGALKWAVNDNKNPFSCLAISGKFYGKETQIINPADITDKAFISQITLMTTVRQDKQTVEKEIVISDLITTLKSNIEKLETELVTSLKAKELLPEKQDLLTDIVITFINKE